VTLTLNAPTSAHAFIADRRARILRGVLHGLAVGTTVSSSKANRATATTPPATTTKTAWQRPGRKGRPWATPADHQSPARRTVLSARRRLPWVCGRPAPVAESGNTPASNASGLATTAVDAPVQQSRTEFKLSPHDDRGLLERAAGPDRRPGADEQLLSSRTPPAARRPISR